MWHPYAGKFRKRPIEEEKFRKIVQNINTVAISRKIVKFIKMLGNIEKIVKNMKTWQYSLLRKLLIELLGNQYVQRTEALIKRLF